MCSFKYLTLTFVFLNLNSLTLSQIPLRSCSGNNGVLKYEVGKSYSYTYGSGTWLSLKTPEVDALPQMKVKGQVILTPLSDCEFVLTLKDTSITSQATDDSMAGVTIPPSSIRFTMQNGIVEEMLVDSEEASWSVNIKKAIVSMLINPTFSPEMDKSSDVETGIHGNCVTEFTKAGDFYTKTVVLSECGEGEGSALISRSVPYQVPLVKNGNLFQFVHGKRSMKCEQKVADGIIVSGSCKLEPDQPILGFYNYEMDATLTYTSTIDKATTDEELARLINPSTINYNFTTSTTPEIQQNAEADILSLVKALSSDASNKADVFIELKKAISRVASLPDLQTNGEVEEINRKVFYDAVAEVPTDEGVELLAKLVTESSLDMTTQFKFYTNLAFTTKPGTKALAALTPLVVSIRAERPAGFGGSEEFNDNVTLGQQLLLGSSALAYQYCKVNPSCAFVPEYVALVNEIAQKAKVVGQDAILRGALHALGNLNYLTPDAVSTLQDILSRDNSAASWINFLALDAFRREPCQSALKEAARNVLADTTKTEELRIHAYLAVSKCIQPDDLTTIHSVMAEESSKGVGGFIASHVRNILDSSSPSKESWKSSLSQISIPDNVHSVHDQPRASKFIEHSTFKEKENFGFSLDAALVFVPGITKPRFVSINGTVDIQGRSFNLLEIGLSTRDSINTMMMYPDDAPPNWSSLVNAVWSDDSYYRIFGTTVGIGLKGLHESMQMVFKSLTPGKKSSEEGMILDLIQPQTLVDGELVYPTLTGLPLTFNLQAVSFPSIKAKGTGASDFMSLMMNFASSDFDFKLDLMTDSAGTVEGSVGVGANTPFHIGYQVVGKMDQNENVELEVIKKEEAKWDFKLLFPHNVIVSKTVSLKTEGYQELNGRVKNTVHVGTQDSALAKSDKTCSPERSISGLKVCQTMRTMRVDGSKETEITFTVEKSNPEMKGFDIQVTHEQKEAGGSLKNSYEIIMATPGSSVHRELRATYTTEMSTDEAKAWDSRDLKMEGVVGQDKYMAQVKLGSKDVTIRSGWLPWDYSFKADYASPMKGGQVQELLDVKTVSSLEGFTIDAEFGGPLKPFLGTVKYTVERHSEVVEAEWMSTIVKSELSIKSDENDVSIDGIVTSYSNGTTTLSTKGKKNGRTYEVTLNYSPRYVSEEVKRGEWSYTHLVEGNCVYEATVRRDGQLLKEIRVEYDFQNKENERLHSTTFQIDIRPVTCPHMPSTLKVGSKMSKGVLDNWFMLIRGEETLANLTMNTDRNRVTDSLAIQGYLKELLEFHANVTLERVQTIHLDVHYFPTDATIAVDTNITDDGNEIIVKTNVVVKDVRQDVTVTTETFTIIDRRNSTLSVLSKVNDVTKGELISKLDFSAQLASNLLNGQSTAYMTLENRGKVYKGSFIEKTATNNNYKVFNSQLEIEVSCPEKPNPFRFTWSLVVDSTNRQPDVFDLYTHISSDKKIISGGGFEMEWVKDVNWYKKKGLDLYTLDVSTNVTVNGKDVRQTEVQMTMLGETESTAGEVDIIGFTKDNEFKDDFKALILGRGRGTPASLMTHNITFQVARTDIAKAVTKPLVDGSVNRTMMFSDPSDFELSEVGRLTLEKTTTFSWAQVIRIHKKELTLFKEISQEMNGRERTSIFLIDVSAKSENHQQKVSVKSHQNFGPCPISNFNFTMSK